MTVFPFPEFFGAPTKLDFVLPGLCSNCGAPEVTGLREVHLYLSRHGLRIAEYPGFIMDVPFCNQCLLNKVPAPVTLCGVSRNFIGKVRRISLHCRNHEFAQAMKASNGDLIASGWVGIIDGGIDV